MEKVQKPSGVMFILNFEKSRNWSGNIKGETQEYWHILHNESTDIKSNKILTQLQIH
jgi:hypothetical protein